MVMLELVLIIALAGPDFYMHMHMHVHGVFSYIGIQRYQYLSSKNPINVLIKLVSANICIYTMSVCNV